MVNRKLVDIEQFIKKVAEKRPFGADKNQEFSSSTEQEDDTYGDDQENETTEG